METIDFIEALLQRHQKSLSDAVAGLSPKEMAYRPGPEANSIAFITWHILRSEDRNFQVTLQNKPMIWDVEGWGQKLGISAKPGEFGFGYTPEQVASFPALSPSLLLEYAQAVRNGTLQYVRSLNTPSLQRKIQHPAFGEMTVGQLIARVMGHLTEHTGQIGFLRGLIKGANK